MILDTWFCFRRWNFLCPDKSWPPAMWVTSCCFRLFLEIPVLKINAGKKSRKDSKSRQQTSRSETPGYNAWDVLRTCRSGHPVPKLGAQSTGAAVGMQSDTSLMCPACAVHVHVQHTCVHSTLDLPLSDVSHALYESKETWKTGRPSLREKSQWPAKRAGLNPVLPLCLRTWSQGVTQVPACYLGSVFLYLLQHAVQMPAQKLWLWSGMQNGEWSLNVQNKLMKRSQIFNISVPLFSQIR